MRRKTLTRADAKEIIQKINLKLDWVSYRLDGWGKPREKEPMFNRDILGLGTMDNLIGIKTFLKEWFDIVDYKESIVTENMKGGIRKK